MYTCTYRRAQQYCRIFLFFFIAEYLTSMYFINANYSFQLNVDCVHFLRDLKT